MYISKRLRLFAGTIAFGLSAFGLSSASNADIVANVGTLSIGDTAQVQCDTGACNTTVPGGTAGGNLPLGTFINQIHFSVDNEASLIGATIILNPASIDVNNLIIQLFEYTSGPTTVGATNATGTLRSTATLVGLTAISATFNLEFSPLLAAGHSYFVQLVGGGNGCITSSCNYQQSLTISAVPLPPALLLLLTALGGFVGYARIRRNKSIA